MFANEEIVTQPVFLLFVAFSFLLTVGYFWGRRRNRNIFLAAFNDLLQVVQPDDQTFRNIGGAIGYHANLTIKKKGFPLSRVDATITLLPRHAWLYYPISRLTRKFDRLFITVFTKQRPREECHLIERGYNGFRGSKIEHADRLNREDVQWGRQRFQIYYEGMAMRDTFRKFIDENPDPGVLRHIAVIPGQKKIFIFMIPRRGDVARYLTPVYRWLPSLLQQKQH